MANDSQNLDAYAAGGGDCDNSIPRSGLRRPTAGDDQRGNQAACSASAAAARVTRSRDRGKSPDPDAVLDGVKGTEGARIPTRTDTY